jgi:Protein of unknown function (DUF2793)
METTTRLQLPLLVAGQVQKEVFHNEALAVIDLLSGGLVEGTPIAAPPPIPVPGLLYRVATSAASGAFAGHEGTLAAFGAGGWRFVTPVDGLRLTERTSGVALAFRNGAWTSGSLRASEVLIAGVKVLGAQAAAVADPSGGTVIDAQVRAVVGQILVALRTHGLIGI